MVRRYTKPKSYGKARRERGRRRTTTGAAELPEGLNARRCLPRSRVRYLAASATASLPQWAPDRPRRAIVLRVIPVAWRWNERTAAARGRRRGRGRRRCERTPSRSETTRGGTDARSPRTGPCRTACRTATSRGNPRGITSTPSHLIPPNLRRPDVPETYKKKPVALLMGYVGAGYSGNTTNASLPRGAPSTTSSRMPSSTRVASLLSNYRSRSLSRLKWSRSSRTDKGVSSLATVVSARLEVDVGVWENDPEGTRIAADINRHLPNHVRVFGAYSTPKSFQARRACVRRTYDYLLPATCLGLNVNGERDEAVAWPGAPELADATGEEVMARFRRALRMFEGSHYFHNYTRRSAYAPAPERPAPRTGPGRRRRRRRRDGRQRTDGRGGGHYGIVGTRHLLRRRFR